jgi:hypothetical protein
MPADGHEGMTDSHTVVTRTTVTVAAHSNRELKVPLRRPGLCAITKKESGIFVCLQQALA